MSDKEVNLPDYISFVYNRFLMTRVEYLIFTQSEQESKVLRIIEWCIEIERGHLYRALKAKVTPGEKVELPEIIWVAISHRFFMDQLQGTVQSETTLKDVLASLEAKHFIFRGPSGPGPYDAPIYTINKHLLATLSSLLPPTLDELDMIAIMKKEREVKKVREGQKLTPSKIDPLVKKIRETIIAPLDPQLLTLYAPKIDPLLRSRGGQKLTPRIYKETTKEESKESNMSSSDDALSLQTEKEKKMQEEIDALRAQVNHFLVRASNPNGYPPEPPQGGATPTLAGNNTSADGGNTQGGTDLTGPAAHHTAILEPPCNATDGLTQESAGIGGYENATPEIAVQGHPVALSIQAVDESNRQATEQGVTNAHSTDTVGTSNSGMDRAMSDSALSHQEGDKALVRSAGSNHHSVSGGVSDPQPLNNKQASGDDLIATGATKSDATSQPATKKPRGSKGKSVAGKEEKPKLEMIKTPPQMPPAEMAWGTRKCMQKFDARREKLLIGTYAISQASTCAKGLAENYTEEDVDAVTEKMNNDPYWIGRGGADICDVARNIHKEIKKIKGQNRTASSSNTQQPVPVAYMTHDEACKLAHDVIVEAKQYSITITAEASPAKNDAWVVRVRWDDGSEDGLGFEPIKVRAQWSRIFQQIRKMMKEDEKRAARL